MVEIWVFYKKQVSLGNFNMTYSFVPIRLTLGHKNPYTTCPKHRQERAAAALWTFKRSGGTITKVAFKFVCLN